MKIIKIVILILIISITATGIIAKFVQTKTGVNQGKIETLLSNYGGTIYYTKSKHVDNQEIQELFKKTDTQEEEKIDLPGEVNFLQCQVINNELYYISRNNDEIELDVFSFANNKSRKICSLGQNERLRDMKYINNDFYIILHSGETVTMSFDTLFKVDNGQLKEIASAHSIICFDGIGDNLYYTDFAPPHIEDNFYKVNIKTGQKENFGREGFSYCISGDQGGCTPNGNFFIKDGYIYAFGINQRDWKDEGSIYKLSLNGKTQSKLTEPEMILVRSKLHLLY